MRLVVCLSWRMNFYSKENGGKKSFPCRTKASILCILIVPSHKMNEDYNENPSLSHLTDDFDYKENGGEKAFLAKPKHQYHVSQWGEHDCSVESQKEWRLIWKSRFLSFDRWTLILWKMVERKASRAKQKLQYHVSQWGEHDCSVESQNNGEYYENPSLTHLMDELWLKGKW